MEQILHKETGATGYVDVISFGLWCFKGMP